MILFTFLCHCISAQIIDKTIYLVEGEEYKVNLDSILKEEEENTYSFKSNNKGFTLYTQSLKLQSDQGAYSILPTKILRERQLIDIEDNMGQGQFGILDQHESGHRICYNNNNSSIYIDQCIELDNTERSYDFVFIDRNTIAVSKIRVSDQQFGVTIYMNKEKISELYFIPSKTYIYVKQTIIEFCVFGQQKYLVIGVTEEDSNIEFLEIQANLQIVNNTKKVISKQLMPQQQPLQVYDIKGALNTVYVVCNVLNQSKEIISFKFQKEWIKLNSFISQDFRGFELGYNFIYQSAETYLDLQQSKYKVSSNQGDSISNNLYKIIKPNAQVRYTLNYLIILQDNMIMVTTLQKSAQRTNLINGAILKIDVEFQNDVLIVFTNTKIISYYLKQATLQYSSNQTTKKLENITIKAVSGQSEQIANINFQVVSKQDYNLYKLQDLTQDLYYNQLLGQTKFSIPIYGISGADIMVDGKVDENVQIIPKYSQKYGLKSYIRIREPIILEQLLTNRYGPYLFRQFDDYSYHIYECKFYQNTYYECFSPVSQNQFIKQNVTVQYSQVAQQQVEYALLNQDGLEITVFQGYYRKIIKPLQDDQFVDMKVGTDRLFVYTSNYLISFYQFPSAELIIQFNLSQYGQPAGSIMGKLWVNQVKTNLLIFTYGEDLIIGRFTTQFIFIQRITIQWVIDVNIIADNKFIVLSTDKTIKKLTQYIIEEDLIKIQRELDPHGSTITGEKILSDNVCGVIMIEGQKGSQRVVLIFGDTELSRDSLMKIIKLEDGEFAGNVIYNENTSRLLIRTTDHEKNSSIIDLNFTYQDFGTNLTNIPNKFSQQLNLKYTYRSQFSQNNVELNKLFYLEYQFQNIAVKQSEINVTYKHENQLKIPIKSDTFQGQVNSYSFKPIGDPHIQLTTRFKNNQYMLRVGYMCDCKQVVQFETVLCLGGVKSTYHNINGENLKTIRPKNQITGYLKQFILRDDGQYALIRAEEKIILIKISQNQMEQSQVFYNWTTPLDISIFYQGWLVVYNRTHLNYFKFQPQENDQWKLDNQHEFFIQGIKQIQYDPLTEQIFYSIGDSNLYYFKSSLKYDTITKEPEFSLNLPKLLNALKIYQLELRITNIQIIIQENKSYIFVSTSYGNIWNITIKTTKVNNMYIINGPSLKVEDIQIVDDFVLVQNENFQSLYKNTPNQSLDRPNLPLEGISAAKFMWLLKKDQKIIHIYSDDRGIDFYQNNIDDQIFLTINNFTTNNHKYISICAFNGFRQEAQVNYQLVFSEKDDNNDDKKQKSNKFQFLWSIWFALLINVIIIAIGSYCCFKNRISQVEPLNEVQQNLEIVQT